MYIHKDTLQIISKHLSIYDIYSLSKTCKYYYKHLKRILNNMEISDDDCEEDAESYNENGTIVVNYYKTLRSGYYHGIRMKLVETSTNTDLTYYKYDKGIRLYKYDSHDIETILQLFYEKGIYDDWKDIKIEVWPFIKVISPTMIVVVDTYYKGDKIYIKHIDIKKECQEEN